MNETITQSNVLPRLKWRQRHKKLLRGLKFWLWPICGMVPGLLGLIVLIQLKDVALNHTEFLVPFLALGLGTCTVFVFGGMLGFLVGFAILFADKFLEKDQS